MWGRLLMLPADALSRLKSRTARLRAALVHAADLEAALARTTDPLLSGALNVDLTLTLARLFDRPGYDLVKERKVSFPMAQALLRSEGVTDWLLAEADVAEAIARFEAGLDAVLDAERLTTLKRVRDDRLAHEVLSATEPAMLGLDDLRLLLAEAADLSADLSFAVDGIV
jgi:hypothetical protein